MWPTVLPLSRAVVLVAALREQPLRFAIGPAVVAFSLACALLAKLFFGGLAVLVIAPAVLVCSALLGVGAGVVAVLAAAAATDFFFLRPVYSLSLDAGSLRVVLGYGVCMFAGQLVARRALWTRTDVAASEGGEDVAGMDSDERVAAPDGDEHLAATSESAPDGDEHVAATESDEGLGHLDAIVAGQVYGWAFNPRELSTPQKITVFVDDRPVAEAAAVYYRPDVAQELAVSGRCGFYVDLTKYVTARQNALIDVRLTNGDSLTGSPVQSEIPSDDGTLGPTLIFMHLPRTGGTAFREALVENYRESEVGYIYPDPPGFPGPGLLHLPLGQRAQMRMIIGHLRFGTHRLFPQPMQYLTIVRNPVARVISHYLYLRHNQPQSIFSEGRLLSLPETLQLRRTTDLDNLMVRYFAGVEDHEAPTGTLTREHYQRALDNLSHFALIGHQEFLNDFFDQARLTFGWRARDPLEVVNEGPLLFDTDLALARETVASFNDWDLKLYEEIQRLFPVPTTTGDEVRDVAG